MGKGGLTQVDPGPLSVEESLLFIGLGVLLADDAHDEYVETTDLLEEVNQRRLDMACILHDHQLAVQHPFQKFVMDEAFNMPVNTPDYGGQCSLFKHAMLDSLHSAESAQSHYLKLFCIDEPECNNELGFFAGLAATDGAYHRTRQQEQRELRNREIKTRVIQQTHAGTFRSPSAIFGLTENAASIFGYIQQAAFSNLNGSLAMFGLGLNGLLGNLGGNGTS